jgi:hypothetical protein
LPEIGISESRRRDDVHRPGEELLQLLAQGEIGGRIFR